MFLFVWRADKIIPSEDYISSKWSHQRSEKMTWHSRLLSPILFEVSQLNAVHIRTWILVFWLLTACRRYLVERCYYLGTHSDRNHQNRGKKALLWFSSGVDNLVLLFFGRCLATAWVFVFLEPCFPMIPLFTLNTAIFAVFCLYSLYKVYRPLVIF